MLYLQEYMQDALEWCDGNMHRRYPLSESATCVSTNGQTLPDSFLVDFQLIVPEDPASVNVDGFYIHSVVITDAGAEVYLGYGEYACAKTGSIPLSVRSVDSISSRKFAFSPVPGALPAAAPSWMTGIEGYLIVGTCEDLGGLASMSFEASATPLFGLRVYAADPGLRSVTVMCTDGSVETLTSDFVIRAGEGIGLSVETATYPDIGTVQELVISRAASDASGQYSSVDDVVRAVLASLGGGPVLSINGEPPDANGNFSIAGTTCLKTGSGVGSVLLDNECSKPCCTDDSATDVRAGMDLLEQAQQRLSQMYESLATNINTIQSRLASLIASRR